MKFCFDKQHQKQTITVVVVILSRSGFMPVAGVENVRVMAGIGGKRVDVVGLVSKGGSGLGVGGKSLQWSCDEPQSQLRDGQLSKQLRRVPGIKPYNTHTWSCGDTTMVILP